MTAGPVEASTPSVSREDITVAARMISTYAESEQLTGWDADLDGRLSTGERVCLSASAPTAAEAISRLVERIEAEGWRIDDGGRD